MLVSWNTTNRCNLACRHCYRDAGEASKQELTTEEALRLIDGIAAAGFKIMIFSGGEPLMRPDILELVEYAARRGLRPVLGTNGTLIDGAMAARLKKAGLAVAGISLDSVHRQEHDDFRASNGCWQAAVDGMAACREAGLPFQIHTTVMDWNYRQVLEITDLAVQAGARGHHIFFLVPTGRGVNIAAASLKALHYEELLRQILQKQAAVPIELKPTCAPQFMRLARQMNVPVRFSRGCLAGISYCIINPVGDVQPCAYMEVVAGNVRQEDFTRLWAESPVFLRLRSMQYSGGCGLCQYRKVCGGCRARALYYHGDYMAEEPWCLYRESLSGGERAKNA